MSGGGPTRPSPGKGQQRQAGVKEEDGEGYTDIEARLDRALDAEMAQRSRESVQMTAGGAIRRVGKRTQRPARRRRARQREEEEGDESEPSHHTEGSWSYAR